MAAAAAELFSDRSAAAELTAGTGSFLELPGLPKGVPGGGHDMGMSPTGLLACRPNVIG